MLSGCDGGSFILAAQPAPTLPICLYHLESNDVFKLLMLQNLFRCVYRKLDSAILVMKSAEDRLGCDGAEALNGAMERGVLVREGGERATSQLILGG